MSTTTSASDKSPEILARLESVGADLEELAEGLPERESPTCREEIITLTHRLSHTVTCLEALAEEVWIWAQSTGDAAAMQRVDAKAQVDMHWAQTRLTALEYAIRTSDGEAMYWEARFVIDHCRECSGYLLRLCGMGAEAAA